MASQIGMRGFIVGAVACVATLHVVTAEADVASERLSLMRALERRPSLPPYQSIMRAMPRLAGSGKGSDSQALGARANSVEDMMAKIESELAARTANRPDRTVGGKFALDPVVANTPTILSGATTCWFGESQATYCHEEENLSTICAAQMIVLGSTTCPDGDQSPTLCAPQSTLNTLCIDAVNDWHTVCRAFTTHTMCIEFAPFPNHQTYCAQTMSNNPTLCYNEVGANGLEPSGSAPSVCPDGSKIETLCSLGPSVATLCVEDNGDGGGSGGDAPWYSTACGEVMSTQCTTWENSAPMSTKCPVHGDAFVATYCYVDPPFSPYVPRDLHATMCPSYNSTSNPHQTYCQDIEELYTCCPPLAPTVCPAEPLTGCTGH